MERKEVALLAHSAALRAGLNSFESGLESGISDAIAGRLHSPSRVPEYRRSAYRLGYQLGRHYLLSSALPDSVADCSALVRRLIAEPLTCNGTTLGLEPAAWHSWRLVAQELAGSAYDETQAMTWHAAKRLPYAYAQHMAEKAAERLVFPLPTGATRAALERLAGKAADRD